MRDLDLNPLRATQFIDGIPDVTHLPCDKITTEEAGDYMRRYHLTNGRYKAIRFHHIIKSDPGTFLHDHPWDFVSVMLTGGYTEITPHGETRYEAPCVITRQAEQLHRLELDGDAWTYVITGRVRRRWGFATPDGWVQHDQCPDAGAILACEPPRTSRDW